MIIYIKIQVILEPFSPVLLLVFAIKYYRPFFFTYFSYYKQLKCPAEVFKKNCKQLVCSYFLHIFKSTNCLCTNPMAEPCLNVLPVFRPFQRLQEWTGCICRPQVLDTSCRPQTLPILILLSLVDLRIYL